MTQEEILEGNKLIAKFIGLEPHSMFPDEYTAPFGFEWMSVYMNCNFQYEREYHKDIIIESFMKFHNDWNWLIPVIAKIYSIDDYLINSENECNYFFEAGIYQDDLVYGITTNDIKITFDRVIEFIKWYNAQSTEL